MTKQEQIEEIAVLGCVRNPKAHTAEECAKCDFKHGMCNAYRHAEALYNAGYRKLPEDSVVLSREEFKNYCNLSVENEVLKEEKEQFENDVCNYEMNLQHLTGELENKSKETAEKFLQLAYDRCLEKSFIKKVEELAKQFGLEIKE